MCETLRLGLVQMASGADWQANMAEAGRCLLELAGRCDLALLPENALCLGGSSTVRGAARPLAELCEELGELAVNCRLPAVFGGVPVIEKGRVTNTSLCFAADGSLLARYDKMHLFQLDRGAPQGIDETDTYVHGTAPVCFDLGDWRIGLSVCYDLRFPELFRTYAPADLLVCTAAFTALTGEAHWEVLLRARAIENQCYMAGAGQCGTNPETGMQLHGCSMVVDPWGRIISSAGNREVQLLTAELRKEAIAAVRERLPALDNRRL